MKVGDKVQVPFPKTEGTIVKIVGDRAVVGIPWHLGQSVLVPLDRLSK